MDIVEVLTIGNREIRSCKKRGVRTLRRPWLRTRQTQLLQLKLEPRCSTFRNLRTDGNLRQCVPDSCFLREPCRISLSSFSWVSFVVRFVDVLTLLQVFPSGNTYFSHTTATARMATASSANKIFADGERSPFRMRETVDFGISARLASSLFPNFAFFIARLIAAIRRCNSPMAGRCHAETALTSGNRVGIVRNRSEHSAEPLAGALSVVDRAVITAHYGSSLCAIL